ncbi:MAG: DUF4199 domain-containing protein [Cyclobacteriaceae bacterium]
MFNWNAWPAYVRVTLRYGVVGGTVGFVLLLILYYIGRHPFLVPVFFDFRIVLFGILMFFSLKEVRDYFGQGVLYFWEGMIGCFMFTLSFAVLASGLVWIFAWLVPAFVGDYISLFESQARTFPPEVIERIGKEVYERNLQALYDTNGFDLAALYFSQSFMIGLFISIIISVILRRQPKN